jgi:hypothetical protein
MGADYYYWVQHVSKAGVPGPVVGSGVGNSGVHAFTSADNTPMLNLLENAITAAHVQAESITGDRMVAATISASRMNVTELSAITANMGAVTAGSVTLDASGFVRGGSTGYLTGSGFWMGYHSTTYKFHIGNPIGEFIAWTGSGLSVQTPQFTLSGGNATFSGELSAATGTFGGGITGTSVIGEAQLAGSAVTAPKIAALQVQAGHMAANSITAGAIAANAVTTGKIAAGSITAASGAIADLAVSTLKIQDNAVTVPVSAYASNLMSLANSQPGPFSIDIISATITVPNIPVFLAFSFSDASVSDPTGYLYMDAGTGSKLKIQILRDSAVIAELLSLDGLTTNVSLRNFSMSDNPGSGTFTYTYRAIWTNAGSMVCGYKYSARSIFILGVKK